MQYTEIAIDLDVIERLFNALTAAQGCKYTVNQSTKEGKKGNLLFVSFYHHTQRRVMVCSDFYRFASADIYRRYSIAYLPMLHKQIFPMRKVVVKD